MMARRLLAFIVLLSVNYAQAQAEGEPWLARADCVIAKRSSIGLTPQALSALRGLGIDHRITQTLNPSSASSNYHGRDGTVDGQAVTAAVDLSVRCLDTASIQKLLSELAQAGFAAWYRENDKDDWKGPTHIHAVWAAEPLKPQLRNQVKSWLNGRTGLVGDAQYKYWQPSAQARQQISAGYEASKAVPPR